MILHLLSQDVEEIWSMTPDQITLNNLKVIKNRIVKNRAARIIKTIEKTVEDSYHIHEISCPIRTYLPYQQRLTEEEIELSLEYIRDSILHGKEILLSAFLINEQKKSLRNEVTDNIVYLTAHVITKDKKVLTEYSFYEK